MGQPHIGRGSGCWRNWLEDLPKLETLKVECCCKPNNFGEVASSQLHHFVQGAYGAITYLHLTNTEGDVQCSFIVGKSRLSLLKQLTISCLELSAAVVATQLEGNQHTNQGVLGYIANKDK